MSGHANFVHLRVHSAFSLLEGAMQPDELAKLCKKHRMPAIAVTDTNNLFGLYDIAEALTKAGVQPIVGCQLTLQLEGAERRGGTGAARGPSGAVALLVQSAAGQYLQIHLSLKPQSYVEKLFPHCYPQLWKKKFYFFINDSGWPAAPLWQSSY